VQRITIGGTTQRIAAAKFLRLLAVLCSLYLVSQVSHSYQNPVGAGRAFAALAGLMLLCAQATWAQTTPANAPSPSPAPASAATPNERAKRDADKVFQMILLHSDKKPAAKSAGKDSAAAGPTPAPAAPARSTTAPVPSAATPAPQQSRPASVASPVAGKPGPGAEAPAAVPTAAPAADLVLPVPVPVPVATPAPTPVAADQKPELAPPSPTLPAAAPNKLELLASVEPEFPGRLVRTLGAGKVVVQFEVAADGTVSQVDVVQSSHRGLDASAVAAVKQWKFKPMSGPASGTTELKFE
jgi:TonB family protein